MLDLSSHWPKARFFERSEITRPIFEKVFPRGGQDGDRKVTLYLSGTNFQLKVWEALLRIPSGYLTSYEEVARLIGKDEAIRAVGNAVAANPISYIIPCHRVIRKVGLFGDYHWGAARKKAIIGYEAAMREKKAHFGAA